MMKFLSFCKGDSFYVGITKKCLDQIDQTVFVYDNVCDISQFLPRLARVSEGSNKKQFCNQLIPIVWFDDRAALFPQKEFTTSEN